MSRYAVRAEGLGKTYRIRHPRAPRWRDYVAAPRHAARAPRTLEVEALRDVSLEVREGEVFGIIGRNGAGKSTLLKILSRITTPTRGRATITGRVASLLEVGTGFHPELTGRENVYLNGTLLGMSRREVDAVFDEICAFAAIGPYIDTPIKRYSSGMQLRLAFAVAAHLAADTMIIDEVLAVGDAEFQAKCTAAMRDAAGRGRTTLFVSHNMAAVENLCSRALLLRRGEVARVGAAADVVRDYLRGALPADAGGVDYLPDAAHVARGPVRFARGVVRGADGGAPVQGEDLVIELDLTVGEPVRRLQVLVWVSTVEGHPVCVLSNADYRAEWDVGRGTYRMTARVPAARLLPRAYAVSVQAVLNWGADILDDVRDAMTFQVLERDVLGTGVPLLGNRGVTWLPAQFALAPVADAGPC